MRGYHRHRIKCNITGRTTMIDTAVPLMIDIATPVTLISKIPILCHQIQSRVTESKKLSLTS